MPINPNTFVKIYLVIFVTFSIAISYKIFDEVRFIIKQRNELTKTTIYQVNLRNITYEEHKEINNIKKRIIHNRMNMISKMKQINLCQVVHNANLLGSDNFTQIVVIKVSSDVVLFKQLLVSLNATDSISNTLVIFSHDVFNLDINKVVEGVNFVAYIQIFYPFSIQLYPNVYPGTERLRNGKVCQESKVRNPVIAQNKLYWWWQMNQVFDHIEFIEDYENIILFLEEDNYVAPDVFTVIRSLPKYLNWIPPDRKMIKLGPDISFYTRNTTVSSKKCLDKIPVGFGFDKGMWHFIKSHRREFCFYNDYSWYNTLRYIGSKYDDNRLFFVNIYGPRVFRIEQCDEKDKNCKLEDKIAEAKKHVIQSINRTSNQPLYIEMTLLKENEKVKPLGYFNDDRDHTSCMYFSRNCFWY